MDNIKWNYVLLGAIITTIAQIGAWAQHNVQFKYPRLDESWWGWYALSIPLTYLFIAATKYNVRSVPTVVIEENGVEVDRVVGMQTKRVMLERLS